MSMMKLRANTHNHLNHVNKHLMMNTNHRKKWRLQTERRDVSSDEMMDSTLCVCVCVCVRAVVYLQKWEKSNKLSFTDASRCLHMEITISCVHELCLDVWISWIMCVYLLRRWLKLRMSCAGRFQISLLTWASQGSSSTQVSENHTRSAFEEYWICHFDRLPPFYLN